MQEIVWRDTWIWDFLCSLFCSVLHFQFSYGIRSRGFLKVLSWLWLSQCSNQGNIPEANLWGNGPVPSMSEVGLNVFDGRARCVCSTVLNHRGVSRQRAAGGRWRGKCHLGHAGSCGLMLYILSPLLLPDMCSMGKAAATPCPSFPSRNPGPWARLTLNPCPVFPESHWALVEADWWAWQPSDLCAWCCPTGGLERPVLLWFCAALSDCRTWNIS